MRPAKTKGSGSLSPARSDAGFGPVALAGSLAVLAIAGASFLLLAGAAVPRTLIWLVSAAVILLGGAALLSLYRSQLRQRREAAEFNIIRNAYEALTAPTIIVDGEGRIVYGNSAAQAMFGIGGGDLLQAVETRLEGNSATAPELARLRAMVSEGSSAQSELQIKSRSGKVEWRSIEASPLGGYPGYVVLRVEDTTSRKEMEQIIREEQEKLVDFLENAPLGFYSVDGHGRFLYVNHTLAEWLGSTPPEIMSGGKRLLDFVAAPRPLEGVPYDPIGGGDGSGEVTLRGPQGKTFQAHISQSIVSSDEANGLRTRSVVRDLTPEREWAEALRHSELRFERIFEDAPMGMALLDRDGVVTKSNRAFGAMVADDGRDVAGAPFADLISEGEREEVTSALAGLAAGENLDAPLEVHPRQREDFVMATFMNRIEDADGGVSGAILHCLDTTAQRNLEVQFAHSQKMQAVGQLAGGVAHDFNNLLTAMIGFCDLLLMRHRPGEQSFADAMQIKQSASRAANLIRQLLAFSRQQTMKPKVLNITDVLAELAHLLRRLIGEDVEMNMVHGRDLGPVRVDQGQLEQVIINLVVNARDALEGGGLVTIRTGNLANTDPVRLGHEMLPPGDYVLIEVMDDGVGISKANIGRIFEPFFSTKEVGSGTGLGLSTVYGIVKQTGGYIFVDSAPGKGAKFSVYLPRHVAEPGAEATEAPPEEAEKPRDLTGAGTVLLVEDEDAVRLFSARALRNKGYTVLEAKSGAAAMQLLGDELDNIDLLITDVVMPEMDGPSLIREARAMRPDLNVICISGYAEDAFRKKLDRSADIHFLPKPFSLNQLAGKVKEVIRVA